MNPKTPGVRRQVETAWAEFKARPEDAVTNLNLGRTLATYEFYDAAEGYLRRAAILNPKSYDAVYLLGSVYQSLGKIDTALDMFERAMALDGSSLPAKLRYAEALRKSNRNKEAVESYRAILSKHPSQPQATLGLGIALSALGQVKDAIAPLRALCSEHYQYGAAHFAIAAAYRQTGDAERAATHLSAYEASRYWEPPLNDPAMQAVLDLNLSHQGLLRKGKKAANSGDWNTAVEAFEESVSEDPFFLVGHINLITVYAHLNDRKKAVEHYEKALALSPRSAELQNNMGIFERVGGNLAAAKRHFERAIEYDPQHYTSFENLGNMALVAGGLDEALRLYERAASIAPHSVGAWVMQGTIHLRRNRYLDAKTAFLQAIRPGADADTAVTSIREAYAASGDTSFAYPAFSEEAQERARKFGMDTVRARLSDPLPTKNPR